MNISAVIQSLVTLLCLRATCCRAGEHFLHSRSKPENHGSSIQHDMTAFLLERWDLAALAIITHLLYIRGSTSGLKTTMAGTKNGENYSHSQDVAGGIQWCQYLSTLVAQFSISFFPPFKSSRCLCKKKEVCTYKSIIQLTFTSP